MSEELEVARARVNALWKEGEVPVGSYLLVATAEPMGSWTTYFLALCKHEQAERLQAKIDRQRSKVSQPRLCSSESVADEPLTFLRQ